MIYLKLTDKLKLQIILLMFCSFSYGQNSKLDSAYFYFKKAKQFDYENKHFKAYKNYIKSLDLYKKLNLDDSIAKCNLEIFELITSQNNLEGNSKPYLDDYHQYALKKNDSFYCLWISGITFCSKTCRNKKSVFMNIILKSYSFIY